MKYISMSLCLLTFCMAVFANEAPENTNKPNYVSINIEIKELKESGLILKDATVHLSAALENASQNLEQLSPEQLTLINLLADKTERITEQLNLALDNIPNAIQKAHQPTSELLKQSLEQVKDATITPLVSKIETWLIVTIIGLCVLAIGLFLVSAYCMKQLGTLGSTMKEIANGYRIIPVEQYQAGLDDRERLEEQPTN